MDYDYGIEKAYRIKFLSMIIRLNSLLFNYQPLQNFIESNKFDHRIMPAKYIIDATSVEAAALDFFVLEEVDLSALV